MKRTALKRIPFFTFPEGGGWYIAKRGQDDPDTGKEEIYFVCPKCRQLGGLGLHRIDTNGEVNASVLHDKGTCGYHEYVILEEWPADKKKLAEERFIINS